MDTVEGLTVLNLRALGGHSIATNPRVSTPLTPCHLPAAQSNYNSILQGWGMATVSPLSESSPAVSPQYTACWGPSEVSGEHLKWEVSLEGRSSSQDSYSLLFLC